VTGELTLIQGWNWYTGADPALIGSNQYDFQSILTHEIGHALGLAGATDPNSPMYETLGMGQVHRTMTVADLNLQPPEGPDAERAARPSPSLLDESGELPQLFNQVVLGERLASQPAVSSQSSKSFGFTLADFSAETAPLAYQPKVLDNAAIEPNRKALAQLDNIMSVGLGAGLSLSPTSREEALIRPLGNDNVPVYANESDFLPLLDLSGQMLWASQSHMEQATQPTPTLTTDGSWGALTGGPIERELTRFHSSPTRSADLWDVNESWGWLFLGMLMIPPTEVLRENELSPADWRDPRRVPTGIR
jgi:hypothetical protein